MATHSQTMPDSKALSAYLINTIIHELYIYLFEAFDFNATPMTPPVMKTIENEKLNQQATWSKHGVSGWFIGTMLEHYRRYKVFVAENTREDF